jgi:hypothetical protein
MDPHAALAAADEAIRDGNFEEATERLQDFADWSLNGGFVSDRMWEQYHLLASVLKSRCQAS